jgi:phosphoribosylformylglycinamidine synthase
MKTVRALVMTGYGLNCDYETAYSLRRAGADTRRVHINQLIGSDDADAKVALDDFHILVFGGGFSWADDHGAGVLMGTKLRRHLGEDIERFIDQGKLIIGICNGFQTLVNFGLLPGFEGRYRERRLALAGNDSGNFADTWVTLRFNPDSPCVFTKGIARIDLPIRHGEGKFYGIPEDLERMIRDSQVVAQYAYPDGRPAAGAWPFNPNGSLHDIAGICDPTGRVFGLMPHPEAFNHFTNHPDWTKKMDELRRAGKAEPPEEGKGIRIFRNAVDFIKDSYEMGVMSD